MSDVLLGIDIGTYSSKGVICRVDGSLIAEARVDHGVSIPRPGYVEHDANGIWWSDVKLLALQLVAKMPKGDKIASVGISTIGPCLVPVDRHGNPLRPGILYGVDTRASKQIGDLEDRYGREALVELNGMRLTSQAIGPKILWLREEEFETYQRASLFVTATSYIIYRLTNRFVIDRHTASHFDPLFDIRRQDWDFRFGDGIVDRDRLPDLGWSDEVAGETTLDAADETGIPVGTPVTFGAVDALSEALSVGVIAPGDLMIMYGSTPFFIFVLDAPIATSELWLTCGAFEGQYALAAGLATSGSATTWFRDQFGRDLKEAEERSGPNRYAELAGEAGTSPAGARGLLMMPYLSGERTPIHDPDARGILAGITLSHTRADIYRALLEGTAFEMRHNLVSMQRSGAAVKRAIVIGGGASNRLWLQLVLDIAGVSQTVPERVIGASLGDAFLAGLAAGMIHDRGALLREWVRYSGEVVPNPTFSSKYDSLYSLFRRPYEDTRSTVHELASFQVS